MNSAGCVPIIPMCIYIIHREIEKGGEGNLIEKRFGQRKTRMGIYIRIEYNSP